MIHVPTNAPRIREALVDPIIDDLHPTLQRSKVHLQIGNALLEMLVV